MECSKEYILRVAELAKINIKEEEISKYKFELEKIYSMIEKLQQVKIDEDVKIYNFAGGYLNYREDKATEQGISEVTSNAPDTEFNYFVVPKVKE